MQYDLLEIKRKVFIENEFLDLVGINVVKFKEIMSRKTQSKLRNICVSWIN